MSKIIILLILFGVIGWAITAPVYNTTQVSIESDEEPVEDGEDPDQILMSLDFETKQNLAMIMSQDRSRQDMRELLQRTIDYIDHRSIADRPRRVETFNTSAKALGRALLNDPRFGSTSEESDCRPPESPHHSDSDYCEAGQEACTHLSVTSMRKILELRAKNRSHAAIGRIYPKYRKDKIDYYRKCVQQGEPVISKMRNVNEGVLRKIIDARRNGRAIHGYNIRRWGLELADEFNVSREYFKASHSWLFKLKKNGRIGSRKITEFISRSENNQQDQIDERIDQFLSEYEQRAPRFPRRLIINMDQTPFNYEPTNKRTLSFVGERDTRVSIDQRNRMTHSFSSQPMMTRDGKVFGKLLLVMQEPRGEFGPVVKRRVLELEREYGNIRVFASKSGKLSTDLIQDWVNEIFYPALRLTLRSVDTGI